MFIIRTAVHNKLMANVTQVIVLQNDHKQLSMMTLTSLPFCELMNKPILMEDGVKPEQSVTVRSC